MFLYRLKYRYLANKRKIHKFLSGITVFVAVFLFTFYAQNYFSTGVSSTQSIQASVVSSGSGDGVQCSTNEVMEIPLAGGSGYYTVSVEPAALGNFYECGTSSFIVGTVSATSVCFKSSNLGAGTGDIIVRDAYATTTNIVQSIPVSVGKPCVTDMNFCKEKDLSGNCIPFIIEDLHLSVGEKFPISYLSLGYADGKQEILALPYEGVSYNISSQSITGAQAGLVNNAYFIPQTIGNISLQAYLDNTNLFASGTTKLYSEPLVFQVNEVNCSLAQNKIFNAGVAKFTFQSDGTFDATGLEEFPSTLKTGDLLVAYYPGGDTHGFWNITAFNSEALQTFPYTAQNLIGSVLANNTQGETDPAYVSNTNIDTSLQDQLFAILGDTANTTTSSLEGDATAYVPDTNEENIQKDYDSQFIIVKAVQPGKAILSVQGASCATSKTIVVTEGLTVNGNSFDFTQEIITSPSLNGVPQTQLFNVEGITAAELDNVEWILSSVKNGHILYVDPVTKNLDYEVPQALGGEVLIDILRLRDNNIGKEIKIQVHVLPAKIAQLQIQAVDPLLNAPFTVTQGTSLPLLINATLENASQLVWQSGEQNSPIFGNPTWEIDNEDIATITPAGILIPKKAGEVTISVTVASTLVDPSNTSLDGQNQWSSEMLTKATLHVEVLPAFTINNIQQQSDLENFISYSGQNLILTARDTSGANVNVSWEFIQNESGAQKSVGANASSICTYTAGPKFDAGTGVVDILRVSDINNNFYEIKITVKPIIFEQIQLSWETWLDTNNDGVNESVMPEIFVGEAVPHLQLQYRVAGGNDMLSIDPDFANYTSHLEWTIEDSAIAKFENGVIIPTAPGETIVTVTSKYSDVNSSIAITVQPRRAEIREIVVVPAFPAIDAQIHFSADIFFQEGIENIQSVVMKFDSPYLVDAVLQAEPIYKKVTEEAGGALQESTKAELLSGLKFTKFMGDYQLPNQTALDGKKVNYTLVVTTKEGSTASNTSLSYQGSATKVAKIGTISIGTAASFCVPNKKLICLIQGLKCLKSKELGSSTQECDAIINVFTNDPANFSILDVLRKYKELRK